MKIGTHATTISAVPGACATQVVYQRTPVVVFDSNTITLNSGGWQTATTKRRMNQTSQQFRLGFTVYQENYKWLVSYRDETIPFVDNMELPR